MSNGNGYPESIAQFDFSDPTTYIAMHLQNTQEPVLTDTELAFLVDNAKRADANNIPINDAAWNPTYDLNSAIVQGWTMKAAKVAGAYHFKDEGLELHREQIINNCLKMATEWSKKTGVKSTPISTLNTRRFSYDPTRA